MKILQQTIFGTEEEQRQCCVCGADMFEGYLNENDDSTYCGATCLNVHMTPKEFDAAFEAGTCFWTNWEVE